MDHLAAIDWAAQSIAGTLIYVETDRSFDFLDRPHGIQGSLAINYVQLYFDAAGRVLWVDGYSPRESWEPSTMEAPIARSGGLSFPGLANFEPAGSATTLADEWPAHETGAGWVVLGNEHAGGEAIEFAPACVAVVDQARLQAVWLRPTSSVIPRR